jgi:hypothetical protein
MKKSRRSHRTYYFMVRYHIDQKVNDIMNMLTDDYLPKTKRLIAGLEVVDEDDAGRVQLTGYVITSLAVGGLII